MYNRIVKRLLDLVLSLLLTPLLVIICLIFGILIYTEDKGPIFYIAERRGIHGKVFNMYKLRSMKVNAPDIRNKDNSTFNGEDDPRVTRIGKFIRKSSIDEIPQLINVIIGDMSFIGPRPSLVSGNYDDLDFFRKKRLEVRPGITGYSQAYFRNSISQEEKVKKDCIYIDNISFMLDVKIFLKTIKAVFFRKNIYNNKK
ncbi:MAG: sugar transferase [Peptoniphilaceae bacterium]|nr:sugar transferase [Peptoniphilaceae bacterium]MDY6018302.1 sugar transferase [Anaerococcus sp.]